MAEHSHAWDIHNIITWLGILMILFWALGKSLGWISSPVWVDMIPVYGAAVALAGTSVGVGKALQKLDRVITDVERIDRTVTDHGKRIYLIEQTLSKL